MSSVTKLSPLLVFAFTVSVTTSMWSNTALAQSDTSDNSDSSQAKSKSTAKNKSKKKKKPRGDEREISAPGVFVQDLLEAIPPRGSTITKLDVDNRLGDVKIVGHDGNGLSIFAVKHAPDADTLERLEVKLVHDPSGPVSIRTQLAVGTNGKAIPAGSARVDLVVRVPRSASVSASVWNGKLRIKNLDANADAEANEGPIHIEKVAGSVRADSAAGSQRFEEITGDLDAKMLEGDVDVDTLRGERMAASVKTGNVTARNVVVNQMVVRVIKGDIRLETEVIPGGSYRIASIAGNVDVRLSGKGRTKVTAKTRKGELSLPARLRPRDSSANEAKEVVGYLGSGKNAAHVEVSTRTGNLVVAQF